MASFLLHPTEAQMDANCQISSIFVVLSKIRNWHCTISAFHHRQIKIHGGIQFIILKFENKMSASLI